jgi:hypothetical protein
VVVVSKGRRGLAVWCEGCVVGTVGAKLASYCEGHLRAVGVVRVVEARHQGVWALCEGNQRGRWCLAGLWALQCGVSDTTLGPVCVCVCVCGLWAGLVYECQACCRCCTDVERQWPGGSGG